MKIAYGTVLLGCCTMFAALPVEPTATLFENDQVKVIRALEKAHVKGKAHEHKVDRVMVYMQDGKQRFEYQDGRKPEVFDWKTGEVKWSAAGGVHAPEVISDTPFNIVEIELKNAGSGKTVQGALDPVKLDPKHYHVEFENAQVRVVRVKVGAHETTPKHEHGSARVTVLLTGQDFRVTGSDGKATSVQHKAGEAVWGTPLTHTEENVSDAPFEGLMVEIKS